MYFQRSDPLQFNIFLFDIDLLTRLEIILFINKAFFKYWSSNTVIFYGLEHMYVSEQCKEMADIATRSRVQTLSLDQPEKLYNIQYAVVVPYTESQQPQIAARQLHFTGLF